MGATPAVLPLWRWCGTARVWGAPAKKALATEREHSSVAAAFILCSRLIFLLCCAAVCALRFALVPFPSERARWRADASGNERFSKLLLMRHRRCTRWRPDRCTPARLI